MRVRMNADRKRSGEEGFTLVELLIVLAILAVLVAVVLPNFTGLLGGAKTTASDAELVIVQTAVDAKMAADGTATTGEVADPTNDMTATGFDLYPAYMRSSTTSGCYTCDTTGLVAPGTCPT
jgi:prepilin-type N-terminal cleavage/methylation domain-containing protein